IHYAFIILTDITELKANEAALKESEQRFRMMAENIQDGLIIVENGKFVFANHRIAYHRIFKRRTYPDEIC
ncbi:MAG: hypothetical protein LUO90_03150, partial [Methanoregula sp.]|nr:hypothetical protein [Methanoregula sp.]